MDSNVDTCSSLKGPIAREYRQDERNQTQILTDLYSGLDPEGAALMTQIILKDLRPYLYRAPTTSTTRNLRDYNTNSYHVMTLEEAMAMWHWAALDLYRVKGVLNDIMAALDEIPRGTLHIEPLVTRLTELLRNADQEQRAKGSAYEVRQTDAWHILAGKSLRHNRTLYFDSS